MPKFKSNNNIVYSCKYHVVWCTKYRRKVLDDSIQAHLKLIIHDVCSKRKCDIIALELMPDHVHLLVEVDPQYGIHRLIKKIKGLSSHTLRKTYKSVKSRLPSLWTNSYFVSTVGGASLDVIKKYVEDQQKI